MTSARRLAAALALTLMLPLAGCLSPAASALLGLLPDGTFSTLLNNMKGVDQPIREKLSALEQKGDWNGVVQLAAAGVQRDPQHADWWIIMGYGYSQLTQYQRAADAFQQATRLEPQDIDAWNLLGQAYRSLGQPERAIRTLDNALRINQDSPVTYYLIGESFSDLKRPDRAVGFLEQAVQRNPEFVPAILSLGFTYAQLGRKTDFDATVQLLQKLNPQAAQQLAATPVSRR